MIKQKSIQDRMQLCCGELQFRPSLTVPATTSLAFWENVSSYNRSLRIASVLLLVLVLSGCQKAPNQESARQAVLDRLAGKGMALDTLDVTITAFEQKGNEAEATVSLKLKDSGQGMVMKYRMRQQGGKWVDVEPVMAGAGS